MYSFSHWIGIEIEIKLSWISIELNLNFHWIEIEFSLNWTWIELESKLNFGIEYCYNELAVLTQISYINILLKMQPQHS